MNFLKINYIDFRIFKTIKKELEQFFKSIEEETNEIAKKDSTNPPPKGLVVNTLPFTHVIFGKIEKVITDIANRTKGILESVYTKAKQLKVIYLTKVAIIDKKIVEYKTQKTVAFSALQTSYTNIENEIKAKTGIAQTELKNLKIDFQGLKRYRLWIPIAVLVLIILTISAGDAVFIANSLEKTGLTYYEKYGAAISLVIALMFLGILFTEVFKTNWHIGLRILVAFCDLILVAAGTYVLGLLRLQLIEEYAVSGANVVSISAFDFAILSLILFTATSVVHWLLWPSKQKFIDNRSYRNTKNDISHKESEINTLENDLAKLPDNFLKEQTKIADKFDKLIDAGELEKDVHKAKLDDAEQSYNNFYASCVELWHEGNAYYKAMVALYINVINQYSANDFDFLVMDDSLKDIPNPYHNYTYIELDRPSKVIIEPDYYPSISMEELFNNENNLNLNNVQNENV